MRQKKKKSRLMTEGYKGLGVVSLPLHDIATTYQSVEKSMELQQCSVTGAVIEFVIIPKIIGETDAMFDDTMSCQSGFSDNSMLEAAEFDDFNKSTKVHVMNEWVSEWWWFWSTVVEGVDEMSDK